MRSQARCVWLAARWAFRNCLKQISTIGSVIRHVTLDSSTPPMQCASIQTSMRSKMWIHVCKSTTVEIHNASSMPTLCLPVAGLDAATGEIWEQFLTSPIQRCSRQIKTKDSTEWLQNTTSLSTCTCRTCTSGGSHVGSAQPITATKWSIVKTVLGLCISESISWLVYSQIIWWACNVLHHLMLFKRRKYSTVVCRILILTFWLYRYESMVVAVSLHSSASKYIFWWH